MNGQDACTESVCLSVERAVSQGGRQPWRAPCNRPSAAAMTSLTRFYLLTTTWITNGGHDMSHLSPLLPFRRCMKAAQGSYFYSSET